MGERAVEAYREHPVIIDAIERRDADAAEVLMREHNRNGRANLLREEHSQRPLAMLRPLGSQ